jgi:hypothetical protein
MPFHKNKCLLCFCEVLPNLRKSDLRKRVLGPRHEKNMIDAAEGRFIKNVGDIGSAL